MTVEEAIEKLKALPNQKAKLFIWDADNEISSDVKDIRDIFTPSSNIEYYIITELD